jgi:hypothetical protein
MQRHETPQSAPPWDLVDLFAPLGAADIARLAADVDDDDLDDAVWRALAPMLLAPKAVQR